MSLDQRTPEEKKKQGADLKTRIISSCFMLPLLVFLRLGGFWLLGLVILCAVRCMHEFYNGWEKLGHKPNRIAGYISFGLWICLGVVPFLVKDIAADSGRYVSEDVPELSISIMFWLFITMVMTLASVIFDNKNSHNIYSGPIGALGSLYIGFLMSHIALIRYLPRGEVLVWLTFVISIFTDTFAYSFGRHFGKNSKKAEKNRAYALSETLVLSFFKLPFKPRSTEVKRSKHALFLTLFNYHILWRNRRVGTD